MTEAVTAGVGDIDERGFEQLPGTEHEVDLKPEALIQTPVETVDHPAHYGGADNPYEAIKVIEAWDLGFCLGNTVKYISRAGKKGDHLEDLRKARWYLDREISKLGG